MADNALVTPSAFSLPKVVDQRTQDKQQLQQQAIPVTVVKVVGELVTVAAQAQSQFTIPQITIPQAFSEWVREPTQVGDKGWAVPSDYYVGGQDGLSGGTSDFRTRGNLTNLVFQHNSQKQFPHNTNRDPNAVFINGPAGALVQTTDGTVVVYIKKDKVYILPASGAILYLGGDGVTGTYDFVVTSSGPSINVKARIG